jgi:hypothetical protein
MKKIEIYARTKRMKKIEIYARIVMDKWLYTVLGGVIFSFQWYIV